MNIFKCTECGNILSGFMPSVCGCGYTVPVINGVYQFTKDKPISVKGDGLKWLGYENVGENYEPGYVYHKDTDSVGNSDYLAEFIGGDKMILDLGAGLGVTSISFARSGMRVIAADISQAMLEIAVKRARKHNVSDKIIFARMNGYKLELADGSVDAVIAVDMLHQVDRPELVIKEILRVLKPDGYFLQYGGSKSLGYTDEQQAANQRYNEAQKDIQSFYDSLITEAGYAEPPFSSWEAAANCIKENFAEFKTLEKTGAYGGENLMEWRLKAGIHKVKTRASGSKQLIPDDIHNDAWAKTDNYARTKYGENYEDMIRYYNFTYSMVLYKPRL